MCVVQNRMFGVATCRGTGSGQQETRWGTSEVGHSCDARGYVS